MTREEMVKKVKSEMCKDCSIYLGGGKCSDNCSVTEIIKALEQEPCEKDWRFYYDHGYAQAKRDLSCEDAISRQAVLDVWHTSFSDNREENEEIQYKKIAFELPSVNPQEPKIGHWIKSDIPNEEYVCSECGGACWYYDYQGDVAKSRYCPNCGCAMKGEIE